MRKSSKVNKLFNNNKFVLVFSLVCAFLIWCSVVITVSPQTTRVIKDVKVNIDESVSSQFGLESFGDTEFYVDVTVTGKKYQISGNNLSAEDIIVTALTTNVNRAGTHNLQLSCESADGSTFYTIESLSQKTINVYFDTRKTVEFTIEPEIVTNGFAIVDEGFNHGDVNLSESTVSISGPSTEINRIDKVVTKYELDSPLVSNLSAETAIVPVDKNGNSDFMYLELDSSDVVLTIPVFKVKVLKTVVQFKNAPSNASSVSYYISPESAEFDTSVEDYANIDTYSVGTIDFRKLKPDSNVFTFSVPSSCSNCDADEFVVMVDLTGYAQDYFSISSKDIVVNNPDKYDYEISRVSGIVVVGKPNALENVSSDNITVELDLSDVILSEGESKEVPVEVILDNSDCWVYGTYFVTVVG